MTTWRRWQDWVVVGLGVVLFVTPFLFGETANSVAASTAYVLGALIALAGARARLSCALQIRDCKRGLRSAGDCNFWKHS